MSHGAAYPGIYGPRSVHHAEEAAQEKYEQGNINGVCDITVRIIKPGRWRQHYFHKALRVGVDRLVGARHGHFTPDFLRSEERRVGKECRSRVARCRE